MGGTSGAILALFFTSLGTAITSPNTPLSSSPLAALRALEKYTPARPGSRTMIDALEPFCRLLAEGKSLKEAAEGARAGAEATVKMEARVGRATYVGGGGVGVPDPGAWGVAVALEGLAEGWGEK